MHVLYVHKSFPAQFGHVAAQLIQKHGFRCSFVTERPAPNAKPARQPGRIERIYYECRGGATRTTHRASRSFENFTWHCDGVLEAVRKRPDIRPDVVVGHSGFGSTLFLADHYACPIVNFCEWFYRGHDCDMEFAPQQGNGGHSHRLGDRCRDAMLLADLDACTLAYSPTNWQRSKIPHEYQHKLETIFDGIDTSFWRPLAKKELGRRQIAGKKLPMRKRIVTYVSRGFESIRGFDVFMRIAQRICERRSDVVFLCVGSDRVCYGGDMMRVKEKSFREHVLKSGRFDLERFFFTGPIAPAELVRALNFSDLHIYLTVPFILSWSLMDALACVDVERMAELALDVLDDPAEYRRTLGERALVTIREKYDLDVVLPRMIRLYERAIRRDVPPPHDCDRRALPVGSAVQPSAKGLDVLRRAYPWPTRSTSGALDARRETKPARADVSWLSRTDLTALRVSVPESTKLILEIGAWRGETTQVLAEHCPAATILAVDSWHGGRFREPEHPDWKAMLPGVWDSFVERMAAFRERVIAMRQRHDDAVREVKARDLSPEVIFYDPDYNSRLLRETMQAILSLFPRSRVVGHDWLWHGVQRELSLATQQTGRRLVVSGNLWRLEPAAVPTSGSVGTSGHRRAVEVSRVLSAPTANGAPVESNGREPQDSRNASTTPLRVLVTIPHFFRPNSSRLYGSGADRRERRVAAVRACLASLYATVGAECYAANLARPENLAADAATIVKLHVVICVSGDDHLLNAIGVPSTAFEAHSVVGDPQFLGYACHEVLRKRLGEFDYYAYMEDDLVLSDPWLFAKLDWFADLAGPECLLQPNRFEMADRGSIRKVYIDGDLPPDKTARYQDVSERPVIEGRFLGKTLTFRRTLNPHAGCFFLRSEQMRLWSERPYFLDRDATFYSPLEGAATVGIMRTFRAYKPASENANFLEIRHLGDAWMQRLAERDQAVLSRGRGAVETGSR